MMAGDTLERARGRWREVLPRLGIDTRFLVNKHGPCPLCGGRDRYRFDDRDGSGSYFCNQCGAGSGIILVQKVNGWDFKTAADEVDKIVGNTGPVSRTDIANANDDSGRRRQRIESLLSAAKRPDVVEDYLRSRGLSVFPSVLHGHHRLPYFDGGKRIGEFPAVVAPIVASDGSLQSAHRIYVADLLERKKLMPTVDTIKGAAVRLFDVDDVIGVAEGVETAIACHERDGLPVWSVISTSGMESFAPPDGVWRVVIYADNDANFAGQKAAFALASRLTRENFTVDVRIPPETDTDWLDVLVHDLRGRNG